jgi:dihydropteroate synthase
MGIINVTQDSFSGDGVLGNDIMLFKKFENAKKK